MKDVYSSHGSRMTMRMNKARFRALGAVIGTTRNLHHAMGRMNMPRLSAFGATHAGANRGGFGALASPQISLEAATSMIDCEDVQDEYREEVRLADGGCFWIAFAAGAAVLCAPKRRTAKIVSNSWRISESLAAFARKCTCGLCCWIQALHC